MKQLIYNLWRYIGKWLFPYGKEFVYDDGKVKYIVFATSRNAMRQFIHKYGELD